MQLSKKVKPTLIQLTAQSNYKNSLVVRHYGDIDMRAALLSSSTSIGILSKTDADTVRRSITNLFIGTSMYFDNVLSQEKADVIAEELLAKYEYRSFKLEDILAICVELKDSEIYKLTPARIIRQIADYSKRRLNMAIELSQQQSEDAKAALGDSNIDERIRKSVRLLEKSNEIVVQKRLYAKRFLKEDSPNKKKQQWKKNF